MECENSDLRQQLKIIKNNLGDSKKNVECLRSKLMVAEHDVTYLGDMVKECEEIMRKKNLRGHSGVWFLLFGNDGTKGEKCKNCKEDVKHHGKLSRALRHVLKCDSITNETKLYWISLYPFRKNATTSEKIVQQIKAKK